MNTNDLTYFLSNPRVMKKLKEAEPEVRLMNSCYNLVSIQFAHGNRGLKLEVEVTHPALAWQCGMKDAVSFVAYNSRAMNSGIIHKLNELSESQNPELFGLISKMRKQGELSDEAAYKLSYENKKAFELCLVSLGYAEEESV